MEKISESVYHLPEVVGGPTILLGETITIVDAGLPDSDDEILHAVSELGRSESDVSDIVITHADPDHIGGLASSSSGPARRCGRGSTRRT